MFDNLLQAIVVALLFCPLMRACFVHNWGLDSLNRLHGINRSKLTHIFLIFKTKPPFCDICCYEIVVKRILLNCSKYREHIYIKFIENIWTTAASSISGRSSILGYLFIRWRSFPQIFIDRGTNHSNFRFGWVWVKMCARRKEGRKGENIKREEDKV